MNKTFCTYTKDKEFKKHARSRYCDLAQCGVSRKECSSCLSWRQYYAELNTDDAINRLNIDHLYAHNTFREFRYLTEIEDGFIYYNPFKSGFIGSPMPDVLNILLNYSTQ